MKTYSLAFDGTGADIKTLRGGHYFTYLVGLLPLSVQLFNAGSLVGDLSSIQAGIGFRRRQADGTLLEFNEVRISSALAQTVQVGVGYGDLDNNAISISSQLTTKIAPVGDDAVTSTGQCYMATAVQPAVAAQNSHVQLWNDSFTPRDAYLDALWLWAGAATDVRLDFYGTLLTTDLGAANNKLRGGPASALHTARQTNAGVLVGTLLFNSFPLPAATLVKFPFEKPVKIGSALSFGLNVAALTVNVELRAWYEFREYA